MSQGELPGTKALRVELTRFFGELLTEAVYRFDVLPALLLYSKRKGKPLPEAREWLVSELRRNVWCRRPKGGKIEVCITRDDTSRAAMRSKDLYNKWKPLSWPVIGGLLGADHSAVLFMGKRQELREAEEARETDETKHPPQNSRAGDRPEDAIPGGLYPVIDHAITGG